MIGGGGGGVTKKEAVSKHSFKTGEGEDRWRHSSEQQPYPIGTW